MPPKTQTGDGSFGKTTGDRSKVQLEFLVRLLYHNCPNPSFKDFEFNDMNYKACWDMLNRIKKETFTEEEIEEMKSGSKTAPGVDRSTPKKATPKRKAADGTPKRTPKKAKSELANEDIEDEVKQVVKKEDLELGEIIEA